MRFDVPSNWKHVTLEQVAAPVPHAIVDGPFGSSLKLSDYVSEGVPVLQGKNITNDSFRWFDVRYISESKSKQLSRSRVRVGDVLIVKIGSIGYSAVVRDLNGFDHAVIPANLAKVTPDSAKIDTEYLHKWLTSIEVKRYLLSVASKTAQPALSLGKLKKLPIPLPPLSEQKRIAEILDRAEALRAKRRAALALLDELTQSIFLDMFGDPAQASGAATVTLEEVADFITGFAFKSKEFVLAGESIRLCRGANVLPNCLDWSDVVFWPKDRVAEFAKFELMVGDVIIAMDRPWISSGFKIAQVTADDCPALLVQRVTRLRGKSVTNSFIYELLRQPAFTRHCKPTETTVPHISPKDIRTFAFCMPSEQALEAFDLQLEAIAKMRFAITDSETLSNQLFASLQHRAFRGEL